MGSTRKVAAGFALASALMLTAVVLGNQRIGLQMPTPDVGGMHREAHLWLVVTALVVVLAVDSLLVRHVLRQPSARIAGALPSPDHRFGFALFTVIAVLQTGHLGEHTVQVSQLIFTDGDLDRSHGMVGRLDFEAVHFWWDTAVWASTLFLLVIFGRRSLWLWLSLFFASIHEVEHTYLYYVYLFENPFYEAGGGFAGILGKGGILPTVERPYLHFGYNFMVVAPMLIAYQKQLWTVFRLASRSDFPVSPQQENLSASRPKDSTWLSLPMH